MTDRPTSDLTPQQRAALALWWLLQGEMTTAELARRLSITEHGARRMLNTISGVIPLYVHNGLWSICPEK